MATKERKRATKRAKVAKVASLQLYDFTDEEFLAVIQDNTGEIGWITSENLAKSIGLDTKWPASNVGVRMGWMRRFGLVERKPEAIPSEWRLTNRGKEIIQARFTANEEMATTLLEDEKLWLLSQKISDRYISADEAVANLMRRQFSVGHYRRRRRIR